MPKPKKDAITPLEVFRFLQSNGIRIIIDDDHTVHEQEISDILIITRKPSPRSPDTFDYHIMPRNPKQTLLPYYRGRGAHHPGGITIGANEECLAIDNIDPMVQRTYYIFYKKK